MSAPTDLATLQQRLLHDPRDGEAWRALDALMAEPANSAIEPGPSAERPGVVPLPPPTDGQASRTPPTLDLERSRPLQTAFAGPGSARFEAALGEQREDWLRWVREGAYAEAARVFHNERTAQWVSQLEALQLYRFGHWCHEQGLHGQAIACLDRLNDREDAAELGLWARLYALRSRTALGLIEEVRNSLPALASAKGTPDGDPSGSLELARQQVAFHATLSLAWLRLGEGELEDAQQALQQLSASPLLAENASETDLLARVLSTLNWLDEHPRDQLSHNADRADLCGFAMAVDGIQLSSCGTLLSLQGWMIDPGRQIEQLCLIRGNRVQRLDMGRALHQARTDLGEVMARCGAAPGYEAGFSLVTVQGEQERHPAAAGEGVELFVVLRNGEQFLVRRLPVSSELTGAEMKQAVDTVFSDRCELLAPETAFKLRGAWSNLITRRMESQPQIRRWGPVPERPELSVVVPLYGRIDFMEYQLNWFNAWLRKGGEEALTYQLIYVLDDPRLSNDFEALARRCQALYRMPFETVSNPVNLGFAGANNMGCRQARSEVLLLLNSDVLPAQRHSLALMLRAYRQHRGRIGALGARLLYDNGGLQHAGMEFLHQDDLPGCLGEVWLNEHPMKGLKLEFGEQERLCLQEVEAATAACLMLSTELFREMAGLSTEFVVGDFEDSDLCLRLRERGLAVMVDLEASFFHLERQSVGHGESDDLLKTKVVAMNACTQQERWGGAIDLLKRTRVGAFG